MITRRPAPRFSVCLPLAALVATAACSKKAPEPTATAPIPTSSAPQSPQVAPAPTAIGSVQQEPLHITWVDPPAFRRVPPSNPMRKAAFVVPHAASDHEDGELTVFYFGPGQGGSIDANVERWIGQFSDVKPGAVKRADRDAGGLREHTVELDSGTFSGGMGMGDGKPKPHYGLLGGIVETPSGPYFFKLTGPSATVAQAKPDFYKLLDSIKTTS